VTSILVTFAGVVLNGDRETLLELLESEGPRLMGLLTRLTLREGVAEDLLQDLFLRLLRSDRLRKSDDVKAYVRRAAVNLAFEWRRKTRRQPAPSELVTEPADHRQSPHERLSRMEQYDRVLQAASRLSHGLRDVFAMRYIQEMTPEEIAKRISKTPHHVRALCHTALSQIRKRLPSWEDADARA